MVKTPKPWTAPGEPKPSPPPKPPRPAPGWRARDWKRMLEEGVYESQSELAKGEGITAAAVSRGLQKLRGEEPRKRGSAG